MKHNLGLVREFYGEYGAKINSVPQKGLCVEATEEQREELRNRLQWIANKHLMSEGFRRDYIFQTVFRYQDNYTLQLLAEELFVSRNVISKDIAHLNEYLEEFHVKLVPRRNSGIIVEGHEFNVRQAMILYNNHRWWNEAYLKQPPELDERISARGWTFISNFYPESKGDLWKIQDLLLSVEKELEVVFTDISFGRLLEYLIMTRERLKMGRYIRSFAKETHLKLPEKYLKAADIYLGNYLKPEDAVWQYERVYLAARLYVASTVRGEYKPSGYRQVITDYVEMIRRAVGQYYNKIDPELIDRIEDMIVVMQYRKDYQIYDWTDLSREIRKRLAGLYAICMININMLEDATGLSFRQDDLAEIVLLVHNYMRKRRKEAVVVTASNEEVVYYNLAKLKEEFPYLEFKGVVDHREFRAEDYEDMLVISTAALKAEAPNIINITKHVSDADMETIRKRLPDAENQSPEVLSKVFNKELVFDLVGKNKEDVLEQISNRMIELGYAKKGILEEVLRREKILSTSVGKRVAIPHVYQTGVLKSGVAIARLKNSIDWSETERVKLLFFFAIGEETRDDVKKIFSHMYNILQMDSLLEDIRETKEHEKVVQHLLNSENGNRH